jgi:tRNA pseudouridine38-40 synthase
MDEAVAYLRATVAYDGTEFAGFQVQARERTVQGELEAALARITQERIRVIGAGRTDSGVHARGQVVAFRSRWQRSVFELHSAWNAVLPKDIAVWTMEEVGEQFHPRFSAHSRAYQYTIWNNPIRDPLLRRIAFWHPRSLDVDAMVEAARVLVGEHDFATFGTPPQGTNTTRRLISADWTLEGRILRFGIEANAFLYRMVRSLVGTMLQVGRGELSVEEFGERFAAADRSRSGPTVPAHGLCLMAVKY